MITMSTSPIGVEFTDRYDALGIPRPKMLTVCSGGCQGIGVRPITVDMLRDMGREVPPLEPGEDEDGWRFVSCEVCGGTGRQPGRLVALRRLPRELWRKARFIRFTVLSRQTWRTDRSAWWNIHLALKVAVTTW